MKRARAIILALSSVSICSVVHQAQTKPQGEPATASKTAKVMVESDGTVQLPAEAVPVSKFLSPEGQAYLTQHLHDMQDPERLVRGQESLSCCLHTRACLQGLSYNGRRPHVI
jgi:hypothetical protein